MRRPHNNAADEARLVLSFAADLSVERMLATIDEMQADALV
jgi:hypothetical protein